MIMKKLIKFIMSKKVQHQRLTKEAILLQNFVEIGNKVLKRVFLLKNKIKSVFLKVKENSFFRLKDVVKNYIVTKKMN